MNLHNNLNKRILYLALTVLLMILIPSCAQNKGVKKEIAFEKWKARAEKLQAYSPSTRVRKIDLPEKREETTSLSAAKVKPEKPLPTQKVTLKMHSVEGPVLLRALAKAADQNIMINAGIDGKININVTNAPWDQVFRGILRTQGLTYDWEGDIIRIMTVEDMEHDLRIDAIKEKRKAQELELKRVEPLFTRIIDISYADANKLKDNLKVFLTKDEKGNPRGSIMVDNHTNSLIIQAIRDDIIKMIPLIQKLDRPTPQVLIEANIVETSRDTARELGIQWGGLYHKGDYWITPGAKTGGVLGQSLNQGIDPRSGMAVNFPAILASDLGATGLTIGLVTEKIGEQLLDIQLSALQEEGKLNILSSPSITTVDNQQAIIESGAEVPFQVVDKDGNISVEFKKAVLRLEVTPHVVEGSMLKLQIVTHKDEVDFTNTVLGNPTIITKKAETNVILYDGQTTVIGGLSKETKSGSESGIPGLKDIPVLGYLFKGEGRTNKMEEVLIFITPHVLKKKEASQKLSSEKQTEKPSS